MPPILSRPRPTIRHTLLLTTQLRVISLGENDFGEGSVSHWSDIKQIEAGYRTSYAINLEGRVYAVGDNSYGQLNVLDWRNIVSISAGVRHVAAVDSMGKAFAAGANTEGQTSVSHITEAKAVACGATFSAFLLKDGRVAVVGSLAGKEETESWTRIVKIAAGENFILGLREDKTVVAAGVNDFGQCGVSHLEDIIDIAGGETHAAFLREDGVVLFTGVSKNGYNTTSGIRQPHLRRLYWRDGHRLQCRPHHPLSGASRARLLALAGSGASRKRHLQKDKLFLLRPLRRLRYP